MADASALGADESNLMEVQVLSPAQKQNPPVRADFACFRFSFS